MTRTLGATALALLGACSGADVSGAGLCSATETTFFSCQTRQQKWINVCGAPPHTLQYRFGSKARVELRYPQEASRGVREIRFANYFRAATDRTEVTFGNQSTDYAVFDYEEDGKRRAGVRVAPPDGAKEVELACRGPIISRLTELKSVLRCDTDNALNGDRCR